MDGPVLETARLRLHPWSDGDDALLNRLSSDPCVVRYILDGARWTREKAAAVSTPIGCIARLQPSNATSAAVAQGLGMRLELETTGRAAERVQVYRVAHADWLRLERDAAG